MANVEKKREKITERIRSLQSSMRDSLKNKENGAAEINVGKVQDEIRQLQEKLLTLPKNDVE